MTFEPTAGLFGTPRINVRVPHPARRYDYWLGGKDNFEADRKSGDAIAEIWPAIRTAARENRFFLQRAVRYAAGRCGIRQFLDIGTGLPTANNTHEVAQAIDPTCRVVYVDNDPLVLAHARALLTSAPEGKTAYVDADVRHPHQIFNDDDLWKTLKLDEPIALMLVAVMHFIPDSDNPHDLVDTYKDLLPAGSLLVLSHGSYDLMEPRTADLLRSNEFAGDFHGRTRQEVERFFNGLTLLGDRDGQRIGLISEWQRTPGDDIPDPGTVSFWGGVGRNL